MELMRRWTITGSPLTRMSRSLGTTHGSDRGEYGGAAAPVAGLERGPYWRARKTC